MSKSSKKLSIFDAKYWLSDGCAIGVNGKPLRGPGIVCGLYLFFVGIGIISAILMNLYLLIENDDVSKLQLTIYGVLSVGWSMIYFYFMYTACKICKGLEAFVLLAIVGSIVNFILMTVFQSTIKDMFPENLK